MTPIRVAAELWGTSLLPEGLIERWLVPDGCFVTAGDPLAAVRIEGALHALMAPADGRLTIERQANAVIEPGAVIGHISAEHWDLIRASIRRRRQTGPAADRPKPG